jgi:hypothetical protein
MVNYATKSTSFQFGKELLCLAHSDASSALPRLKVLPLPTHLLLFPTSSHPPITFSYFFPPVFITLLIQQIGNLEIEFFKNDTL